LGDIFNFFLEEIGVFLLVFTGVDGVFFSTLLSRDLEVCLVESLLMLFFVFDGVT